MSRRANPVPVTATMSWRSVWLLPLAGTVLISFVVVLLRIAGIWDPGESWMRSLTILYVVYAATSRSPFALFSLGVYGLLTFGVIEGTLIRFLVACICFAVSLTLMVNRLSKPIGDGEPLDHEARDLQSTNGVIALLLGVAVLLYESG